MSESTQTPLPPGVLPAGVERKDATVLTQGLNPILLQFLTRLGLVHLHLFGAPVVITSAVDAKHAPGSKHYKGDAVDLRIDDMTAANYMCLLVIVKVFTYSFPIAVFDEARLPGAPHLHIEIAG